MEGYDTDNIFQKIIHKEVPAHIVYEDDHTLAFLDIQPVEKGHTLVIPKESVDTALKLSDAVRDAFWETVTHVSHAVMLATKADGCNIASNVGASAGQEVFHAHTHIIPRYNNKERHFNRSSYKDNEAENIREEIIKALNSL